MNYASSQNRREYYYEGTPRDFDTIHRTTPPPAYNQTQHHLDRRDNSFPQRGWQGEPNSGSFFPRTLFPDEYHDASLQHVSMKPDNHYYESLQTNTRQ